MPDRQIAGRLDDEHREDLSVETTPMRILRDEGHAVDVQEAIPVLSEKAGDENSAYLVVRASVGPVEADSPETVYVCHCWDFVARQFDEDPQQIGYCKHVEKARRLDRDPEQREAENQGLDAFGGSEDG